MNPFRAVEELIAEIWSADEVRFFDTGRIELTSNGEIVAYETRSEDWITNLVLPMTCTTVISDLIADLYMEACVHLERTGDLVSYEAIEGAGDGLQYSVIFISTHVYGQERAA
jgi:hypothetical protein